MSIEQSDRVDAVGVDASSGKVILTISDDLDWSDESSHLLALQDKLNAYLRFIESGELLEKYPAAAGRKVRIQVFCKYAPSLDGERLLERAREIVEGAGFLFSWRVLAA